MILIKQIKFTIVNLVQQILEDFDTINKTLNLKLYIINFLIYSNKNINYFVTNTNDLLNIKYNLFSNVQ